MRRCFNLITSWIFRGYFNSQEVNRSPKQVVVVLASCKPGHEELQSLIQERKSFM